MPDESAYETIQSQAPPSLLTTDRGIWCFFLGNLHSGKGKYTSMKLNKSIRDTISY